jgi:ribosome-associated toxin RatA of RatAB toxin-antitoxin module
VTIAGMREIKHSALVAQPPGRLFALINDIESYPRFIPWCTHAKVQSRSDSEIVATVGVQRGPFQSEFTTRNVLEPDRRIVMHLVNGPFKMFEGEWLLSPIPPAAIASVDAVARGKEVPVPSPSGAGGGCRVQLTMKFAFKNPLTAMLFEQKFAETAASLMDAFVARARALPPRPKVAASGVLWRMPPASGSTYGRLMSPATPR